MAFEVRENPRKKGSNLQTIACISDESGFKVASVIIAGAKKCAVVDAQWTMSNGYRVLAEILDRGLELETIYVSHAHPDHYFGTEALLKHFPDAKVIALPDVCKTLQGQFTAKKDEWVDQIGVLNVPVNDSPAKPMSGPEYQIDGKNFHFFVEGEEVVCWGEVMGDLRYNTVVTIPSLSTLIGSDMLFNQAHPFTCEVNAAERKQWIADMEKFKAMNFETVIPGHAKHGLPFDDSSYDFTIAYVKATDEQLAKCKTSFEFYYNMRQLFKDAELWKSDEMNARVLYNERDWDWREDDATNGH
ncbi:MAG: MBL fold metallo-hydrolase [Oscillospiraceae bacterium]|jgi:glyoxylase-like metal-dependent hydrolase (beta-lactamase superfamily II)|nr:MBL fold metallo-hydrolase [Oscillospiraceae bacterium]